VGRRVFISYAQADRAAAAAVLARLEAGGIDCWIAPRDITPSASWAEEIIDAIAAAQVMVLMFSSSANASQQVHREVERAVHRGLAVLPMRLEDVLPSKSLEYFLSTQHWMDAFPPPLAPYLDRLYEYLSTIVSPGSPTPAVAAPPAGLSPGARGRALDAAQLERLELELASYIGPIAKHLVQRAAGLAPDAEALIEQLGAEIDSEAERRRFLSASRQMLRVSG
jgi:hypothetical protein